MADYTLSAKITGDASSFQKAVAGAEKAASSFEKRFEGIGKKITSIGDNLSKCITIPAVGAATALAGVTLKKGWDRMTAIDNAKVKLEAIGNSAEDVTEIMNNALASVKGTAYGMDEAATTAASAVAAGIKPGEKLEKYLSAVADAASVAGRDMADMGSIFNKVATQGKATNEVLGQLAESGIPIYQYLADTIGCTEDKIYDMAKNGEIDLASFQKAVEEHIGGAAKTIGSKTITGAISNIGASISRIGANLLGSADNASSFAGQLLPILNNVTARLGIIEDKAASVGSVFGETFGLVRTFNTGNLEQMNEALGSASDKAKALYEKLNPTLTKVKEFTDAFSDMSMNAKLGFAGSAVAAGPLLSIVGKCTTIFGKLNGGVSKSFLGIKKSIALLPDSFKSLKDGVKGVLGDFKNIGTGVKKASSSFGFFGSGIKRIFNAFKGSGNGVSSFVNGLRDIGSSISLFEGGVSKIGGSITSLLGKAASFAPVFLKSMSIAGGIGIVVAGLGLLQSKFGGQIDEMLAMVTTKGPEIITNLCNGIVEKLPDLMAQGSTLINNLLSAITANLPSILTGGIAIVSALVSGLAGQLPILIPAAVDMITTLAGGLAENVGDILNAGFDLLLGLVDGIITALPSLISSVPVIISNLVNGIAENLPQIISTGMELLISLVTGLIDAIPNLIAAIPKIFTAFKMAFEETNWAEIGSNLLEKIKEGFLKVKDSLINAVKDITDRIKSMFNIKADVKGGGSASVSVSTEQLAHGTDYWQGGFAYMNEGGRGELTYLPNGSQVIPHDISVKYAKEAARSNTSSNYLDVNALGEYIVTAVMAQGKQQADALEKGIGSMRMVSDGRETARFMTSLGFQKAKS